MKCLGARSVNIPIFLCNLILSKTMSLCAKALLECLQCKEVADNNPATNYSISLQGPGLNNIWYLKHLCIVNTDRKLSNLNIIALY